jgi:hypothetical protein
MNLPAGMKWPLRMAVILVAITALDAMGVVFIPSPRFWATAVPALIPALTVVFVVIPILNERRR